MRRIKKPEPIGKDKIREIAILIMKSRNCDIWPQNNVRAVRGRTFVGRKGLPDIIGFQKATGIFCGVEVKTQNDRLSDEQITFLSNLKRAGGLAMLAVQEGSEVVLKEWVYDDIFLANSGLQNQPNTFTKKTKINKI